MEEKTIIRLSELTRLSGYLIAGGALVGFSVGIYRIFNHAFFSFFVEIAESEAVNYFLAVFMPSFVILIIIGYLFTTTFGLKELELSNATPLCLLSLVSIVLSALSIFYFVSLIGSLLALAALVTAYTKPSFSYFSTDLAFFCVEIGSMFVAAFSALFLLMWTISSFFVTYAIGLVGSYSPGALLLVVALSFIMFFAVPILGSNGRNAGTSCLIGFSMSLLWLVFIVQNQYVLFSTSVLIGVTLLFVGFSLAMTGSLTYLSLFLSAPNVPIVPATTILSEGKYCPNCGSRRATAVQKLCSTCGRELMWTPASPFCSSCGRVVPSNSQVCPHCFADLGFKRYQFGLTLAQEQEDIHKLSSKPKKPSWITEGVIRAYGIVKIVVKPFSTVNRIFNSLLNAVIDRINLTMKETVYIILLTFILGFIAFIGHVRVESQTMSRGFMLTIMYGFPLEWLHVGSTTYPIVANAGIRVLPAFLIIDVILYFFAAFFLVYGIERLRH